MKAYFMRARCPYCGLSHYILRERTFNLADGPIDEESIASFFEGKELPSEIEKFSENLPVLVGCPVKKKTFEVKTAGEILLAYADEVIDGSEEQLS